MDNRECPNWECYKTFQIQLASAGKVNEALLLEREQLQYDLRELQLRLVVAEKVVQSVSDQRITDCGDRDTPGACARCPLRVCAALAEWEGK